MTTFRFVHLSDLHLAREPEILNFNDFRKQRRQVIKQAFRWSNFRKLHLRRPTTYDPKAIADAARIIYSMNDIDVLLITGDIATTGTNHDQSVAKDHVDGAAAHEYWTSNATPTLSASRKTIALLPGNHDRYQAGKLRFGTENDAFDVLFNNYWSVGQNAELIALLHKDAEWLAIIGADFSLRHRPAHGRLQEAGRGVVRESVLLSLLRRTAEARQDIQERYARPLGVIWAIHFAPECDDHFLKLEGDDTLLMAAATADVRHILCGHTHVHRAVPSNAAPTVTIHCASSTSSFLERAGNFLHVREFTATNGIITASTLTHRQLATTTF